MHIVSTNFAKTLIWKHGYDVTNSAHQIHMTTICHWMKTLPDILRTPLKRTAPVATATRFQYLRMLVLFRGF